MAAGAGPRRSRSQGRNPFAAAWSAPGMFMTRFGSKSQPQYLPDIGTYGPIHKSDVPAVGRWHGKICRHRLHQVREDSAFKIDIEKESTGRADNRDVPVPSFCGPDDH